MPCRRSRVRVPSAASRKARKSGPFVRSRSASGGRVPNADVQRKGPVSACWVPADYERRICTAVALPSGSVTGPVRSCRSRAADLGTRREHGWRSLGSAGRIAPTSDTAAEQASVLRSFDRDGVRDGRHARPASEPSQHALGRGPRIRERQALGRDSRHERVELPLKSRLRAHLSLDELEEVTCRPGAPRPDAVRAPRIPHQLAEPVLAQLRHDASPSQNGPTRCGMRSVHASAAAPRPLRHSPGEPASLPLPHVTKTGLRKRVMALTANPAAVLPRIGGQRPRASEVVEDEVQPGRLAQASPGRPPSWW